MEKILKLMQTATVDHAFELLCQLIAELRPAKAENTTQAVNNIQALCYLLEQNIELRAALRRHLLHLLSTTKQVHLYTDTGILSNESLYDALVRRIGHRLLPPKLNLSSLKDLFGAAFNYSDDYVWFGNVPHEVWQDLGLALHFHDETDRESINRTLVQMLEAIQVLSCRVSAIGLEPEIVKNHPDIERFESPFVRQNVETLAWIERYRQDLIHDGKPSEDDLQIRVLLAQCEEVIAKVRKNAAKQGVSVSLTYLLIRLRQHIDRLKTLLTLANPDPSPEKSATLLCTLHAFVTAENRKYSLKDLFAENTELLALQVTEHASHTGEHYIAETRRDWAGMFKSAAGAGVIVGFMAMLKILITKAHLPLLLEAIAFSMNYAFGFMFIHIMHFTVATKQPAMTAAKIAASIHLSSKQKDGLSDLVELIVKVFRTQFVAIAGNVLLAMPVALLIGMAWQWQLGEAFVNTDKANHLLQDLSPIASLAIFHAAIAGVCLFMSGLISGYYDNKAIYNEIPERIAALPWLNRLFGTARTQRMANYIEHNLGALAGNFYFGIMLGSIGTIGALLGLPIDIRHITFSSANFSFALVAQNFQMDWHVLVISLLGVALIGMTNLVISFTLALWVALRSRKLSFRQTRPLLGQLISRFLKRPADFFIPTKEEVSSEANGNRH
ncbi:site-specific recombinase [Janthinobacterium sp. B9-8]|uniref:site-specific recombinase n=1 Tax=Janthinobacterium sp. B9-8 TaxID=1236179 RepID=UPI00061D24E7|nr:site-specific recombinase [Janthinobacterium sp. B9-8]AMC35857.1 recombinase [Janthinobacterium sp. B9-8]